MTKSPKPFSVRILVYWYAINMGILVVHLTSQRPIRIGFTVISDFAAFCYVLLQLGIVWYVMFGLSRLRETARRVAIGYECYKLLDGLLWAFRPAFIQTFLETATPRDSVREKLRVRSCIPIF